MDYFEGVLLGTVWSDTDYENRSHKGAALLISALFWVGFTVLLLQFYADTLSPWFQRSSFWLLISLLMIIISPVLSYYYYKCPLLIRFLILFWHAAKYIAAVLLVYSLVVPAISLNFDTLLPDLLEWMDNTVGTFVERNTEVYELFGLLVSGLALVLIGIISFVLAMLAIALTPILYMQIVKYTQRLLDVSFLSLVKQILRIRNRYKREEQLRANRHTERPEIKGTSQPQQSESFRNREASETNETGDKNIKPIPDTRTPQVRTLTETSDPSVRQTAVRGDHQIRRAVYNPDSSEPAANSTPNMDQTET